MNIIKILRRIHLPIGKHRLLIIRQQRFIHIGVISNRKTKAVTKQIAQKKAFSSTVPKIDPPKDLLKGKNALITGVGGGIGLEALKLFTKANANIIGIELNQQKVEELQTFVSSNRNCEIIIGDVSNEESVKNYTDNALKKFNGKIDILVNNAAAAVHMGPTLDCSNDLWYKMLNTNVMSILWNCKHIIPKMVENNINGSVINVVSCGGLLCCENFGVYIASKHAAMGLTKQLSLEYVAKGVRVNAVCPGWIDTPLIDEALEKLAFPGTRDEFTDYVGSTMPIKRMGHPIEIAQMILWLASDASSLCSGQPFIVDSGLISRIS
eukprot:188997_1